MLEEFRDVINAETYIQNNSFLKTKIIYLMSDRYVDVPIDDKAEEKFEFAYLDTWIIRN